ncbi:MAG: dihydrolipoyl dehydrogenase [Gemmatimonadaceae bacterium]|nr:dihydrolipoyl dehydrogenase [Gemmatimonadaceae bacterium]
MASFDVIILGGGPAGYVCAIRGAQLGLQVAVIEREALGGTCVLWGCIPAKSLLESASLAVKVKKAAEHGITLGEISFDYGPAMQRSRGVSTQNSKGVEFLLKKNKVTYIRGHGRVTAANSVEVKDADGKLETHTAGKALVLATGSRVRGLPQVGLELNRTTVLSSDDVLVMDAAPTTMAVIGAGAVGCEFADVFNAFGTQVTMIEVAQRILPIEDADCSAELARAFKKRGIETVVGAKITASKVEATSVTISFEAGGQARVLTVDKVLVAAGRAPNVDGFGLEALGVKKSDRGFIAINEKFETSVKGVYAIGDVAGNQMLAHKGSREGHVLADMLAGQPTHPVNYGNIPSCTYCHPEVASVGMTEEQVKAKGLAYKIGKFPFSANGRARTSGETDGFVKIIRDEKHGEILGAHIIGSHATELIHELVVARENEFTVEEIDLALHAHPTLSEAIAEAVLDSMGKMVHA